MENSVNETIRKYIKGIVNIVEAGKNVYVYTQNVSAKVSVLNAVKDQIGAKEVEIEYRFDRKDGLIYKFISR